MLTSWKFRAVTLLACGLAMGMGTPRVVAAAAESSPTITTQPQPQTVFPGVNVQLRVAATPSIGLRYYWRFYGSDLPADFPGQYTPLLTLPEVTAVASGPYSVVVSNKFGAVTSETAVVTVNRPVGFAVGYVNLTAAPGFSMLSQSLIRETTNQFISQLLPAAPEGSSLFKVDGNGFVANNFLDGWSDPEMILSLGEGWFFHNPGPAPFTLTFIGGVVDGRLINRLPAGYSICANIVPQGGLLSQLLGFPGTPGVKVHRFNPASQGYVSHQWDAFGWFPVEPTVTVSESFWVHGSQEQDWVRDFMLIPHSPAPITYLIVQPTLDSETGEINFFTFHPDPAFGRVVDFDTLTPLDREFDGQLYAGLQPDPRSLVPIGRPLRFLDGAGAGYLRGSTLKLPGVRGGQRVYLQLRVWEHCAGRTYEQAVAHGSASGRSEVFSAIARAAIEGGGPGLPPLPANSFPSFAISPGQEAPFQLSQATHAGTHMELCFTTQPGRIYCLQRSLAADEPMKWEPVPGREHIVGTGHVYKYNDSAEPRCFYRLCPTPATP